MINQTFLPSPFILLWNMDGILLQLYVNYLYNTRSYIRSYIYLCILKHIFFLIFVENARFMKDRYVQTYTYVYEYSVCMYAIHTNNNNNNNTIKQSKKEYNILISVVK